MPTELVAGSGSLEGVEPAYLVVARGHGSLVGELRAVIGELAWVRAIEDRRSDATILPREGRSDGFDALTNVRRRLRLDFA